MTSVAAGFETQHTECVHDVQLDYYSKRMATCSSDRVIKIFNIGLDHAHTHAADLMGHEGPVWQVAWAHPRFGSLIASCGYDRRVIVWRESPTNVWTNVYTYTGHEGSVNSVAWAPQEYGLCLAAGSSDGSVSILTHNDDDTWTAKVIKGAHQIGCNSVSWAPPAAQHGGAGGGAGGGGGGDATSAAAAAAARAGPGGAAGERRLVSGGCDNSAKVWVSSPGEGGWRLEETLSDHRDWVRAVAWASNIGVASSTIATGSQDGRVVIWTQEDRQSAWVKKALPPFNAVIYGLSWSPIGSILAVAAGDNKVSLWKESLDGEWQSINSHI